jgi:hypothetical protein
LSLVASLVSAALYLLPVAVLVLVWWARAQPIDQLAVHVPAAVAVDLVGIMLLARWFQLDVAVVISRAGWALGLGFLVMQRVRARAPLGRWPRAETSVMAVAGLLALLLSVWLSRRYVVWDRNWHIPLVTSLRGQSIPFMNVFQPQLQLGYHVSGDVLAATLQTLSGARLHAAAALSLAHDILFVLTAMCISALVLQFGQGRAWSVLAALAPLAVFLSGPPNVDRRGIGYALFNFYSMTYRPHVVLAGLLLVGITGVALRLLRSAPGTAVKREVGQMLAMVALLASTDEPSVAMVVPAFGLVLLVARRALAWRLSWLFVPAAMAAVVLLAWWVLPSTVRGGPSLPTRLVPPQVPSFYAPVLPLSTLVGLRTLLIDIGSMLVLCVVLGWAALRWRGPAVGMFAYGAALLVMGTVFLTCVVVADRPGESHRFMTLPQAVLPLLTLCVVTRLPWSGRAIAAVGLLLPMAFTVNWAKRMEPELQKDFRAENFSGGIQTMDCREATGARLFEAAQPTYVPRPHWYAWSGCRPVFAPGRRQGLGHTVDVYGPIFDKAALSALGRNFAPDGGQINMACPAKKGRDRLCQKALATSECTAAGRWRVCALSAGDRAALLGRR